MGARAHGLGNASSCLSDAWSLTNNIAGLATTEHPSAAFSYDANPSFKYFNRMAAVFCTPIKSGAAGIGVFRFGDDLYNEQILFAGIAHRFGLASLGAKINYIQYQADGFGTNTAVTVSAGGIAEITPRFLVGAHVVNINQPVINELSGERIATRLAAGISIKPSDKLTLATEIEKDLEYPPILKTGLEYQALKKIAFRTGFNLNPQTGFVGAGFKPNKFDIDYALQISWLLGLSHHATIAYQFRRK